MSGAEVGSNMPHQVPWALPGPNDGTSPPPRVRGALNLTWNSKMTFVTCEPRG